MSIQPVIDGGIIYTPFAAVLLEYIAIAIKFER